MRISPVALSLAALVSLTACGGTTTQPGGTPTVFELTAAPATITGAVCTGCGANSTERESVTAITIRETGGVAGTVTSIAMSFRETGTNAVIASGEFNQAAVAQLCGANRLAASAALTCQTVGVHYGAANAGRAGAITYTIRVNDDRGNVVIREIVVAVTAA